MKSRNLILLARRKSVELKILRNIHIQNCVQLFVRMIAYFMFVKERLATVPNSGPLFKSFVLFKEQHLERTSTSRRSLPGRTKISRFFRFVQEGETYTWCIFSSFAADVNIFNAYDFPCAGFCYLLQRSSF